MWKFFNSSGQIKETALGSTDFVTLAQFAALTPTDGMTVRVLVDAAAGVVWTFRYNAGSASAYKWEFLGGPPLVSEVATSESVTSTSYGAMTTPGPLVVLPRAGDYEVSIGARMQNSNTAGQAMSYDIGATAAVDADQIAYLANAAGGPYSSAMRTMRKIGLSAITLTSKYLSVDGNGKTFAYRRMAVLPVRIS